MMLEWRDMRWSTLPVHKLDRCHHVIPVWPYAMSEDGGDAVTVVALVVRVVSERDRRAAHCVLILDSRRCVLKVQLLTEDPNRRMR